MESACATVNLIQVYIMKNPQKREPNRQNLQNQGRPNRSKPQAERVLSSRENRRSRTRERVQGGQVVRRSVNLSTIVVAWLFFIVVLVYLVQALFNFFNTPEIPVDMLRLGSIDTPTVFEGIIIRDETIYTAPQDGVLHFSVAAHERIRPGTEVASIQNIDRVAGIQRSISHVEEQILNLQDIRGDLAASDPAVQLINAQITNMVDTRLNRHINLNVSEAFALRDAITQSVNTRNQMIVSENIGIDLRAGLSIQHNALMGELNANRAPIRIGGGGTLATVVDGFEGELTPETMYALTPLQTRQNVDFNRIIMQQEVYEGDPAFKIVNSNIWFIAAYVPNGFVENANVGTFMPLYISGRAEPLTMQLHHLQPGVEESFVIFRSTAFMTEFLNTRSVFFRLSETINQGFMIPNTAITEERYLIVPLNFIHGYESPFVIRVLNDEDMVIPIIIEDRDEFVAFIPAETPNLAVGNTLRSQENLQTTGMIMEERVLNGVFRVDRGIAVFVPIYKNEDTPTGSVFTVLDPAINSRLREFQHIVTDAATVDVNDIVFRGVR